MYLAWYLVVKKPTKILDSLFCVAATLILNFLTFLASSVMAESGKCVMNTLISLHFLFCFSVVTEGRVVRMRVRDK